MGWLKYTIGRILVVWSDRFFSYGQYRGWELVKRHGTQLQRDVFTARRFAEFQHELKRFTAEIKAEAASQAKVASLRPPEGLQ